MILVIGATGNVGGSAVRDLAEAGVPVRALSRHPDRTPDLGPHVEPVYGDVERPETIASALTGVERVLLCANSEDLTAREAEVVRLAEEASVRHLVLLSSLGVELGAGSGPVHAPSERMLQASSLPWTILRPITYMTNTLRWRHSIAATGTFEEPSGDGRQAMIHPADIGSVAAHVLTTPGHEARTYELTGPEALTSAEYAAKLSAALGREVRHVNIGEEVYRQRFASYGAPPSFVDSLMTLYALVRDGRLDMVSPDVENLLGRTGRTFDEWAHANAGAFGIGG